MQFEWNKQKAETNAKKHGVGFIEAQTIFADPLALTFEDLAHSYGEVRLVTFGMSSTGMKLVVSHTERGETIRLISARKMTKHEMVIYEQG